MALKEITRKKIIEKERMVEENVNIHEMPSHSVINIIIWEKEICF